MKKVKLIYCGKRLNSEGVMRQMFLLPDGNEVFFSGLKNVWVGHTYEAQHSKAGGVQISTRPVELETEVDSRADEWRSKEWAATSEQRALSLRKKLDRGKDLIREIEKLKQVLKGLSHSEKRAFVDWLVDQIEREEREKTNREFNAKIQKLLKRVRKSKKPTL